MQKLVQWHQRKDRKPLIVKGTRQVGKTYLLKEFGRKYFPRVHYVNFEKTLELADLFEQNLDPQRIIDVLGFYLDVSIDIKQDLVIFDEIQECPKALTSLKYFQEEMPELALCSASSLLGIHLTPSSFPVGKVNLLTLYPMSFEEFLEAIDDQKSVDFINQCTLNTQTPKIIHQHIWEQLKLYFVVGGLPNVVDVFSHRKDELYSAMVNVRECQKELIKTYNADMAKHAGKVNAMHIDRVWKSVPQQLARSQDCSATKFKFKGVVPGVDRYQRLSGVIDWLENAGLIIKSSIINTGKLPLSAFSKESVFKLFLFDVGILGALSGLAPKNILDYDYGSYKGYFAENYVAQAFLSSLDEPLFAWEESRSKVEFLREKDDDILPVEVKSGLITKAKSLQKFAEKYPVPYRTIISAQPLHIDLQNKLHRYPLYLAGRFPFE